MSIAQDARMLVRTRRDLLDDMARFGSDLADRRERLDAVEELLAGVRARLFPVGGLEKKS